MVSRKACYWKSDGKWVANRLKITIKRFKQLYAKYKTTNTTPTIGQNRSRPKKSICP